MSAKLPLDFEVIQLIERKYIADHQLEKVVGDPSKRVRIRRKIHGKHGNVKRAMEMLLYQHYDDQTVLGTCCENVVSYMPVPVRVVVHINLGGRSHYVSHVHHGGCVK